ncbi:hypothetical protein CLOM621_07695 [Clostridium sp. M62/1]|nr:hypothetical protein [Clostridium sp. M62/1]EFE12032.1 hypothetical protein CLOM621_07695 [Clostridium sp. M62/1]
MENYAGLAVKLQKKGKGRKNGKKKGGARQASSLPGYEKELSSKQCFLSC